MSAVIDSWGKFPEGILEGHVNAFGDYDECVKVDVSNLQFLGIYDNSLKYSTKFRGLYCNIGLQVPAMHENGHNLNESNAKDLATLLLVLKNISIKYFCKVTKPRFMEKNYNSLCCNRKIIP